MQGSGITNRIKGEPKWIANPPVQQPYPVQEPTNRGKLQTTWCMWRTGRKNRVTAAVKGGRRNQHPWAQPKQLRASRASGDHRKKRNRSNWRRRARRARGRTYRTRGEGENHATPSNSRRQHQHWTNLINWRRGGRTKWIKWIHSNQWANNWRKTALTNLQRGWTPRRGNAVHHSCQETTVVTGKATANRNPNEHVEAMSIQWDPRKV